MCKRHRSLSFLFLALALAGCAKAPHSAPAIDTRYRAQGQDSRVQYVILHYTDAPLEPALLILTQQEVSAHYLVSDKDPPVVYRLVDEERRAWHAGQSSWQGATTLNSASIGIEIVNPGQRVAADGVAFAPYPPAQIDLVVRWSGTSSRATASALTACWGTTKCPAAQDRPRAGLPLARARRGWPDRLAGAEPGRRAAPALRIRMPEALWFQHTLATIGYAVPDSGSFDTPTRRVIAAFQMKYRPSRYDGEPAETAALMQVLAEPLRDSDGR